MWRWLKRQWDDIKGNVKYDLIKYFLLALGVSVVSALVVFAKSLVNRPPSALEWWLVPVLGLLASLLLALYLSRKEELIKVHVEPTSGPSPRQLLSVTNLGKCMSFTAYGEVLAHPNGVNDFRGGKFRLGWSDDGGISTIQIDHGNTERLLIASFEQADRRDIAELVIWEVSDYSRSAKQNCCRWLMRNDESLPAFTLRVTLNVPASKYPFVRTFHLTPKTYRGPLQMTEVAS